MSKAISVLASVLVVAVSVHAGPPPIPATPAKVEALVYARPFTLEQGFRFCWNREGPQVQAGTLLVLKVDPKLVIPRQAAEPVLYVGNQTAERINHGHESGYVVALVPGHPDLSRTPIWFGTPELPERVDAATIQAERALAERAGIKPFSAKQVQAALNQGGRALNVRDKATLLKEEVARLIERYSPQEKYLAEAFRVPTVPGYVPDHHK